MTLHAGRFAAFASVVLMAQLAGALEIIDRAQPRSLEPLLQSPVGAPPRTPPPVGAPAVAGQAPLTPDLDAKLASLVKQGDCVSILESLAPAAYEKASPQSLAVVASCEPPGKDPEKMFAYAEKQAPDDDAILLLHARYRWHKQRPDAEDLFLQLRQQSRDPRIQSLAAEYIVGAEAIENRPKRPYSYFLNAQIGGVQDNNPEGLPSSDGQFGKNTSTAAVAQVGGGVRRTYSSTTIGVDYVTNDATYWTTHDADLLTQDADAIVERAVTDSVTIGLRPYGSFYLLNGTRYYSLYGVGLTSFWSHEAFDQLAQVSAYRDDFAPIEAQAEAGSHLRLDYRLALKKFPTLQPALLFYVDRGRAGADLSNGNFIPYTNTTYGAGVSFEHLVHRYSVGVSMRAQWRKDDESTRIQDASGSYVSKRREDVRFIVRPNLTVPLRRGFDLFFYFESDSVTSSLRATDGFDRNVSDSILGALLRFTMSDN